MCVAQPTQILEDYLSICIEENVSIVVMFF